MTSIKKINRKNPIMLAVLATVGAMREPFIFSISKNNSRPPSSAGNGKRLIIAKFTEISAAKDTR